MQAPIRIVPQGEIAKGTAESPPLKLPDPVSLFVDRAARLKALAALAADGEYLALMGSLADAQHAAARQGLADWKQVLRTIVPQVSARLRGPAIEPVRALASASDESLEELGNRVLEFDYPSLDARVIPFIGAALQVQWARRAAAFVDTPGAKYETAKVCPVCASPPVASTLRIDVPTPGSRYLHCALCATNWRLPRGQCSQCDMQGKLAYFHVEGGSEVVKAEACEACHGYLKVMNQEKDPLADPVADDLATLALDVLVDESGYHRASPNLFFVPGQT